MKNMCSYHNAMCGLFLLKRFFRERIKRTALESALSNRYYSVIRQVTEDHMNVLQL